MKNKYIFDVPTPYFVVDEALLERNLRILSDVRTRSGAKILLAQKAFSSYAFYPQIARHLDGVTASGLFEARLGAEKFAERFNDELQMPDECRLNLDEVKSGDGSVKKENHVFSPAYKEEDFSEINRICDHIVFNSFSQVRKFKNEIAAGPKSKFGIRINPEYSTQKAGHARYDPCGSYSRMGVTLAALEQNLDLLPLLGGFHFHTLCEQGTEPLAETLAVVEKKFSAYFGGLSWLNFGGGHHITRADYNIDLLVRLVKEFRQKYNVEIYLEPGEAVVLNTGFLVATVLDIVENGKPTAILDASAACHMPDVLEVPYTPVLLDNDELQTLDECRLNPMNNEQLTINNCGRDEGQRNKPIPRDNNLSFVICHSSLKKSSYFLAGNTCLAGDCIGEYTFDEPLKVGDKITFCDMALYTMVKTNTFNGTPLPALYAYGQDGAYRKIKEFGYRDFLSRL